jgi:hypothetical protein
MSGYNLLTKIRRLEAICDKMGFMLCHSKHGYHREFGDVIAIKPKDQDSLPIYSRDAELFVGTFDQLEIWLQGLIWARDYDRMVFGSKHESNRERKEQDVRNKKLVKILTDGAQDD